LANDYKNHSLNMMNDLGFDDSEKNRIFEIIENI